ncbi:MAG: recombinase family protein [Defluviitaleaceae bacterium]|nr:recombinase family protein [Defluviitaleaceae bacterium]
MAEYGYIRVSSTDQNEGRQLLAMQELGIPQERIFIDKQSGKDFNRPEYQRLVGKLKTGDLVYFKSIDRMGRNYEDIQNEWRKLTKERGVDVVVIDIPLLDTRINKDLIGTLIADLFLQILSFMAQSERDNIRQRQAEGIKAARARGVRFGRPEKEPPENFGELIEKWEQGGIDTAEMLSICGFGRTTLYAKIKEYKARSK